MEPTVRSDADIEAIRAAIILDNWHVGTHKKVAVYVGKFFDRQRIGKKIVAKVVGNHGVYTVSLSVKNGRATGACSCYVGRDGCHHCGALAKTFLNDPDSFAVVTKKSRTKIRTLDDLERYLEGVTLDELTEKLKERGITQTAFAESVGMSPRHLTAIKSSERRHHYFHELGATKLACLWVIENIKVEESTHNKAVRMNKR